MSSKFKSHFKKALHSIYLLSFWSFPLPHSSLPSPSSIAMPQAYPWPSLVCCAHGKNILEKANSPPISHPETSGWMMAGKQPMLIMNLTSPGSPLTPSRSSMPPRNHFPTPFPFLENCFLPSPQTSNIFLLPPSVDDLTSYFIKKTRSNWKRISTSFQHHIYPRTSLCSHLCCSPPSTVAEQWQLHLSQAYPHGEATHLPHSRWRHWFSSLSFISNDFYLKWIIPISI